MPVRKKRGGVIHSGLVDRELDIHGSLWHHFGPPFGCHWLRLGRVKVVGRLEVLWETIGATWACVGVPCGVGILKSH